MTTVSFHVAGQPGIGAAVTIYVPVELILICELSEFDPEIVPFGVVMYSSP
jgi:hypothetical protein